MYFKTTGIVLHSLKYADTSLVTTIYTQSHGRKTFLVQGVYRKQSKFSSTYFQPLTLLDLEISISPKRELQRIKEASIHQPYHSIPYDHSKTAIALFLSEILYKTLREEETNQLMFDYLLQSFQILDLMEHGVANFHLWFMIHLTKPLGFFPVNNYNANNCVFDSSNGRFYAPLLKHPTENDLHIAKLIHDLIETSPSKLDQMLLHHKTRDVMLETIIDYFHMHLGGLGTIKSLPVLQGVFEDL